MRRMLFAATLLAPIAGRAQGLSLDCNWQFGRCEPHPIRIPSGDANLDRAITICDAHRDYNGPNTIPETLQWQSGYGMCGSVNEAWEKTKVAADRRARKKQEDADRAFLGDYANTLKE